MGLDWWRFIDAQRRIRVKVALFDSAVLDRYRAAQRSRESEDRSALYLCVDHLRIDRQSTIHRADDTFHPHISFLVEGHLRHLRKIASKGELDRKSTRLNSSHQIISYAVFCLKKKK